MNSSRLATSLEEMAKAGGTAFEVSSELTFEEFAGDEKAQLAIAMCFLRMGEQASKIYVRFPEFVEENRQIPWNLLRGMRNRIAHDYTNVNLEIVWATLQTDIPPLLQDLKKIIDLLQTKS